MTTEQIELSLMFNLNYNQNYIVPNITNIGFQLAFEADMLYITKLGYATCFEIKVSKSDLKNDLKKSHIKNLDEGLLIGMSRSYTPIEYYYKKLKFFNYAVPEYLVEDALNQIPNFAGLYYFINKGHDKLPVMKIKRHPKIIHNYKWTNKEILEILRLGTMRIYNLKRKLYLAK